MRKRKFRKMLMAVCLSAVMIISVVPVNVLAEEGSAKYGDKDYTLVESGDYSYIVVDGNAVIIQFHSTAPSVTIPSTLDGHPVVEIYGNKKWNGVDGAFEENTSMQTVIIPNSVKKIGAEAFRSCSGLQQVLVGSGVTEIDEYAFAESAYMQKIQFNGDHLLRIGESAFKGCVALDNLTIPNTVTTIENNAFRACSALTEIVIPDSVTELGHASFAACSSLIGAVIGDGVPALLSGSYGDDGGMDYYTCGTFENCTSLLSVTIGSGVKKIETDSFAGCKLQELTIPDTVEEIDKGAFSNNLSMKNLIIGNGVVTLGNYSFINCLSLERVTIGNHVQTIGVQAFRNCTSLTGINIPSNVVNLGGGCFTGCTSMQQAVIGNGVKELQPDGYGSDYGMDYYTAGAFEGCSALEQVTIGSSVKTIGAETFAGAALKEVLIPDGVVTIEKGAFSNNTTLEKVEIGSGCTAIGKSAFQNDAALLNVTIGKGVVSIGDYAFANCQNLSKILVPSNVTDLGAACFAVCTSLEKAIIGNGVTAFKSTGYGSNHGADYYSLGLFEGCTSLKDISIGSGVTSMDKDTFAGTAISSVLIPAKVSSIGKGAFYSTDNLKSVYFSGNAPSFGGTDMFKKTNLTESASIPALYSISGKIGYDEFDYPTQSFEPIKVIFSLNDSSIFAIQPNDQMMSADGGYVIEPIDPMAEGYLFQGWYQDAACTTPWSFTEDRVTQNTTIYAKWDSVDDVAPVPPKAPEATMLSDDTITINWNNVGGATGYYVYVNGDKKNAQAIAECTYTIEGLEANTSYEICVTAENSNGESEESLIIVAKTEEQNFITYVAGDVNGDEIVNLNDAQIVLKAALGIEKLEGNALLAADYNKDETIDLTDAQLVLKVALGIK